MVFGSCLELGGACKLPPARKRQLAAGQVSLITVFQGQSEVPNSKGRAVVHSDELPPESQANYRPSHTGRPITVRAPGPALRSAGVARRLKSRTLPTGKIRAPVSIAGSAADSALPGVVHTEGACKRTVAARLVRLLRSATGGAYRAPAVALRTRS